MKRPGNNIRQSQKLSDAPQKAFPFSNSPEQQIAAPVQARLFRRRLIASIICMSVHEIWPEPAKRMENEKVPSPDAVRAQ